MTISFFAFTVTRSPVLRMRSSTRAPSAWTAVQQSSVAASVRARPRTSPADGTAFGVGVGGGYTRSGGKDVGGGTTPDGSAFAPRAAGRDVFQARNPTPARSNRPMTTSSGRASGRFREALPVLGTAGSGP